MSTSQARWVLAFDASCGTCREVSRAVAQAGDGKLEIMPLTHDDVREWRARAMGPSAPWTPTLLRIQDHDPRAWTGKAMGIALVRHLGPRSTVNVLRALGRLRHHGTVAPDPSPRTLSRAGFFQLAAGAVAAGVIIGKASPAAAATQGDARAWIEANKGRLPHRYDDFAQQPLTFRRAIFAELTPEAKSRLWVEHLNHHTASRPGLSPRQRTALRNAAALAATTALFAPGRSPELLRGMDEVERAVRQAFGNAEARALVATLGPAEPLGTPACNCASVSDFCNDHCSKGELHCVTSGSGCGLFWVHPCDGLCVT